MHYNARMRTTIELDDGLRARVLALAARRRLRGFSRIVEEALERFLAEEADAQRSKRVAQALAVLGSLSARSAAGMSRRAHGLRRRWRA